MGAAAALALAKNNFKIRLLEPKPPVYDLTADTELRVSAISHASKDLLQELGAWDLIASTRVSPYRQMHVWEEASSAFVHFDSAELQQADLGNIIENELIRYALFKKLEHSNNVTIQNNIDIAWTDFSPTTANIALKSGEILKSNLVIGADGALSKVRDWVGIEISEKATGHFAVVANVKLSGSHQKTAWQKFLANGPLAFLPLSDGGCSIVWSTVKSEAEHLVKADADEFLAVINQKICDAPFAPLTQVSRRLSFPLIQRHARAYHRHNVVLVGDATHTIHPLAGQGVNLGLADVKELVRVLTANKKSLGKEYILAEYARCRRAKNELMLQSMQGLKKVFGISDSGFELLRAKGIQIFNKSYIARQLAMQKAVNG